MLPEQQIVSPNSEIIVDFVYGYGFGTDSGNCMHSGLFDCDKQLTGIIQTLPLNGV
jgi:hypothetical protein